MTMFLFRNAQLTDLDAIYQLATNSGIGLTTLPKSKSILKTRLALSDHSFNKNVTKANNEYYLFVLEDPSTQQIIGSSAIEATTGCETPFYSYKLTKKSRVHHELNHQYDENLLNLVNDHQGKSELCTLYLKPDYRHSHLGAFLSRARFIYMAQYPERFQSKIIAEMRGVSDTSGESPFWKHVGQNFFKMPFGQADELTLSTNKQFIADLHPKHPINISLLNKEAQIVIGEPHGSTRPAMHILLKEGFKYDGYVDIFDAGPTIEAARDNILTINNSQFLKITNIAEPENQTRYIIGNHQLNFKATIAPVDIHQHTAIINQDTADLLQLRSGDYICCSLLLMPHSHVAFS